MASVHKNLHAPGTEKKTYQSVDQDVMRAFIAHAQTLNPTIPASLHNYLVAKYVEKRKAQTEDKQEQSYMYVTPRTLLGIIRLSQAFAKLNFRNEVTMGDVDESIKLMDFSLRSLRRLTGSTAQRNQQRNEERRQDLTTESMKLMREITTALKNEPIAVADLYKRMLKRQPSLPLSREELDKILDYYKRLNVVYVDGDEQVIFL